MTFDFVGSWTDNDASAVTGAAPRSVSVPPLARCAQHPPLHPSLPEVAALVSELFTEGTLSWAQLNALGHLPEMKGLLVDALACAPMTRKNR